MAGALTAITQRNGSIQFMAHGTYTQPADDNATVHIHLGWVPKVVIASQDPIAAVGVALDLHLYDMADALDVAFIDATDVAADGVTLRNAWTVTTGHYYIKDGESVLSTASTSDVITGFTLGDAIAGGNATKNYWLALG